MAERVCPPLIGYWLLNPLRKLVESPARMLGPFVKPGMIVLEPGPGMGFFTLPLARLVGPAGRVVVVEVQQKMLNVLVRRARRAGLSDRIDSRLAESGSLGISDLAGRVDFAAAVHVAHEVPDRGGLFRDVFAALKPAGRLLLVEPKGHVSAEDFEETLQFAKDAGFAPVDLAVKVAGRSALLSKGQPVSSNPATDTSTTRVNSMRAGSERGPE
jgi:tRNA A58 N-methylase Trm61